MQLNVTEFTEIHLSASVVKRDALRVETLLDADEQKQVMEAVATNRLQAMDYRNVPPFAVWHGSIDGFEEAGLGHIAQEYQNQMIRWENGDEAEGTEKTEETEKANG